jgi:hypothetical protein
MNSAYMENGIQITVIPFGVSGVKKIEPVAQGGYATGAVKCLPKPRYILPMREFTPEQTCQPVDELLEEIEEMMDQGLITLDDAIERLDAYHSQSPHWYGVSTQ